MTTDPTAIINLVSALGNKGIGNKETSANLAQFGQNVNEASSSGGLEKINAILTSLAGVSTAAPALGYMSGIFATATAEGRVELMTTLLELVQKPEMQEFIKTSGEAVGEMLKSVSGVVTLASNLGLVNFAIAEMNAKMVALNLVLQEINAALNQIPTLDNIRPTAGMGTRLPESQEPWTFAQHVSNAWNTSMDFFGGSS